jgi:exonuclease III
MSLFSVNCRRVGNALTVRELKDFVVKFYPSILCIQETQISRTRVEALASTFGFDNAFAVDTDGRSGGLGIYWNNDISIDVLGYSQYHIDVSVSRIGEIPCRHTSVYGEAQTSERDRTWNMMKDIASTSSLPWLCLGDFNEVLHADEHEGVGHRTLTQMQGFREMIHLQRIHNFLCSMLVFTPFA